MIKLSYLNWLKEFSINNLQFTSTQQVATQKSSSLGKWSILSYIFFLYWLNSNPNNTIKWFLSTLRSRLSRCWEIPKLMKLFCVSVKYSKSLLEKNFLNKKLSTEWMNKFGSLLKLWTTYQFRQKRLWVYLELCSPTLNQMRWYVCKE